MGHFVPRYEFSCLRNAISLVICEIPAFPFARMCELNTMKRERSSDGIETDKAERTPAHSQGPATQRIVIDEGLWFDAPLFEDVVKDVDEALGERIISNWQVETDGTRLIVSSNPPLQDLQECRPSKIAHMG